LKTHIGEVWGVWGVGCGWELRVLCVGLREKGDGIVMMDCGGV